MTITVSLAAAQANLTQLVDQVAVTHQRVEVTRDGVPAAVLLSSDDYAALLETLAVLSDADLVHELSASRQTQEDDIATAALLASLGQARSQAFAQPGEASTGQPRRWLLRKGNLN